MGENAPVCIRQDTIPSTVGPVINVMMFLTKLCKKKICIKEVPKVLSVPNGVFINYFRLQIRKVVTLLEN